VVGSAVFVVKPSGLVEINPQSFVVGKFLNRGPWKFQTFTDKPLSSLENPYKII
jgi:hypothetical protein